MIKPKRNPDFRSSGVEFWFHPEFVETYETGSNTHVVYKLIEHEGNIYRKEIKENMKWHSTVQNAYKAHMKKLNNEIDKILLS